MVKKKSFFKKKSKIKIIKFINYKDINYLKRFIKFNGKITSSNFNSLSYFNQRKMRLNIKYARYLFFSFYTLRHKID